MGGDAVLFREGGLGRDGVTRENNASSSRSNTQVPQPLSLQFDSSLLLSVFIGIQPAHVILSVVQTFDFNLEENRHNPTRKQAASRKRSCSAPETPLTLERSLASAAASSALRSRDIEVAVGPQPRGPLL